MKFGVVFQNQKDRLADLHPGFVESRPDLAEAPLLAGSAPDLGDFPCLFYLLDKGRVVGFRKALPDIVHLDGQPRAWAWGFDAFTEPDYRGQGVGRRLLELQIEETGKRGIISGAAFSAPSIVRMQESLGFHVLGFAPRMCLVLNTEPFLPARVSPRPLRAAASMLGNAAFAVERALRRTLVPAGAFDVELIDEDPFADLFDRSARQVARNYWASRANWILSRLDPADSLYQVRRAFDAEPCALLVVRSRALPRDGIGNRDGGGRRLTLMEFARLDEGPDVPRLIAASLARLLVRGRADAADVITSWQPLLDELSAIGFRRRGTGMSFAYKLPSGMEPGDGVKLADWHLTHFCSDGFMFE